MLPRCRAETTAARAAVDAIYKEIGDAGLPVDGAPRVLATPGGGYGFGFKDPEGRNFAVTSEAARHAPPQFVV